MNGMEPPIPRLPRNMTRGARLLIGSLAVIVVALSIFRIFVSEPQDPEEHFEEIGLRADVVWADWRAAYEQWKACPEDNPCTVEVEALLATLGELDSTFASSIAEVESLRDRLRLETADGYIESLRRLQVSARRLTESVQELSTLRHPPQ